MSWQNLGRQVDSARQRNHEARGRIRGSKRSLSYILNAYQEETVEDVRRWEPEIFGKGIPFVEPKDLTETEIAMMEELRVDEAVAVYAIQNRAADESVNRFPPPTENIIQHDGHQDAFRHAYWNSLMTGAMGESWAESFATAHERKGGVPESREAMDLHNNEVGRKIALENPDASAEELSDLVYQAVMNGEMLVINQSGDLAWSNEVCEWTHGSAD